MARGYSAPDDNSNSTFHRFNYDSELMDLVLLRTFLALAERLHFGRSSEYLDISQPALSQRIRRLEDELGVALFHRTSRSVRLTDAGEALVPEARRVIVSYEQALAQTRNAAAGGGGHLAIASVSAGLNGITPMIVGALRRNVPGVAVQLTPMDTPEMLNALRYGHVDIGIARSAGNATDLRVVRLVEEPMVVVLPADHRLVARARISPADLRDEEFVLWPRSTNPSFHDQVLALCAAEGFRPQVAMEGTDIETQLGLVSAGVGVSLQPASFANLRRTGVEWRPLAGVAPRSWLELVWREPVRSRLVTMVGEIAHEQAGQWSVPGLTTDDV
jgi:DNA-binding transcriptional LysR family regulator